MLRIWLIFGLALTGIASCTDPGGWEPSPATTMPTEAPEAVPAGARLLPPSPHHDAPPRDQAY